MNIRQLDSTSQDFEDQLNAVLKYDKNADIELGNSVTKILTRVRRDGDKAVMEYTARFDRLKVESVSELELGAKFLKEAWDSLEKSQRECLSVATRRIRAFHEKQVMPSWDYQEDNGTVLGQIVNPIERVGLYVPGGKASYPSSVLMNAIPAKVAGVSELIMVVPTPQGDRNTMVLAAAYISGVDRVFTIGGAQAVGALAYGTDAIPRVDKIVGPGNSYVAEAKRQVFGQVGIDMIAGPSEILVVADPGANAEWVAMDLFSQAEHDELAQAILIAFDSDFLKLVSNSMDKFITEMPRSEIITASLHNRSAFIKVRNEAEAVSLINRIAPEHLELAVSDPRRLLCDIKNAGSIFLGNYSSEALGDYCAGPNHVLPTQGTARFSSPLGVYDFQKRSSVIEVSERGATELGIIASEIATGEGLHAHAQSALMRVKGT